jgi:hypothetical protein
MSWWLLKGTDLWHQYQYPFNVIDNILSTVQKHKSQPYKGYIALYSQTCVMWPSNGCGRWWLSLGSPVSSTNKADCHNITDIVLKVALNTIALAITETETFQGNIEPGHTLQVATTYMFD